MSLRIPVSWKEKPLELKTAQKAPNRPGNLIGLKETATEAE